MGNLRELIETDLGTTLEGDYALPVELIDPDGASQSLVGQVLYDTTTLNPETGEAMTVNDPIVTLRRTSLTRIPEDGERWIVKIPTTPSTTAPLEDFTITGDRPTTGGGSIGYIRLHLQRVSQI